MKCRLAYRHPVTGNRYYFVDFKVKDGILFPVGCFMSSLRYSRRAMVFANKSEAKKVADYLKSISYDVWLA